jgi:integrase
MPSSPIWRHRKTSAPRRGTRRLQAALLFLYRTVLGGDVAALEGVIRARRRPRLPVVLTVAEVKAVLDHLGGAEALVVQLLYGSGCD